MIQVIEIDLVNLVKKKKSCDIAGENPRGLHMYALQDRKGRNQVLPPAGGLFQRKICLLYAIRTQGRLWRLEYV